VKKAEGNRRGQGRERVDVTAEAEGLTKGMNGETKDLGKGQGIGGDGKKTADKKEQRSG